MRVDLAIAAETPFGDGGTSLIGYCAAANTVW